jgi:hypothetical protein
MNSSDDVLHIAEIPYETGELHYRYARALNADGTRWIRHGLYQEFHQNGQLASEGSYENGLEQGLWRDWFPNGQLAAEGYYQAGEETGQWRFWHYDGTPESPPEK